MGVATATAATGEKVTQQHEELCLLVPLPTPHDDLLLLLVHGPLKCSPARLAPCQSRRTGIQTPAVQVHAAKDVSNMQPS